MSFWAMGMPVSMPASPFAILASAARAWASERSGSTVIKAFRSLYLLMRSRKARVSSTLEISFRRRAAERAATVLSNMAGVLTSGGGKLLYDLGHQVQAGLDRRRDFLELLALVGFGDRVRAQPQACLVGVGHGRDTRGIHGVHLLDQAEDAGQGFGVGVGLRLGDVQTRKMRDFAYLLAVKGHGNVVCIFGYGNGRSCASCARGIRTSLYSTNYHIRPAG